MRRINLVNRLSGVPVAIAGALYLPWLSTHLAWDPWPISAAFLVVNASFLFAMLLNWITGWTLVRPNLVAVLPGVEPDVTVIIPTCGEPVEMVVATLRSVLEQDYPDERLVIVVSDDRRDPDLASAVEWLADSNREVRLFYHRPYRRSDPLRRGEAKAGNLNSAMDFLDANDIRTPFVETRDADDLVGDRRYLRFAVGAITTNSGLAYVQSIKSAIVAPGDPFGNCNRSFYQASMFGRNRANAVFPCGSGVVWRRSALDDIGHFPAWNMVEDLQSGIEALRRGWEGICIPVIGALAQVAPEDLPNMYKQRGVWALDAFRLTFWQSFRGLNVHQRLYFYETAFSYGLSLSWVTLMVLTPLVLFLDVPLVVADPLDYAWRFWFCMASMIGWAAARSYSHSFDGWLRNLQVNINLAPLWAWQGVRALFYGPSRKPVYRVTKKSHDHRFHLWFVIPQILAITFAIASALSHLARAGALSDVNLPAIFWAAVLVIVLGSWLPRAWFGVSSTSERLRVADLPLGPLSMDKNGGVGGPERWHSTPASLDRPRGLEPSESRNSVAVTPRPMRVAIIGAGAAGLAAGRALSDGPHDIELFEAADEAGGMASSFLWHDTWCDFGPHRLLLEDDSLRADMLSLADLVEVERTSCVRLNGKTLRDPINGPEYALKNFPQSVGTVASYLLRPRRGPTATFSDVVKRRYGTGLHDRFFAPYVEKLFGLPAADISPEWAERKLRVSGLRDIVGQKGRLYFSHFWYPATGGYGSILRALEESMVAPIHFSHQLSGLEKRGDEWVATFLRGDGSPVVRTFDAVVATVPVTAIAELLGTPLDLSYQPMSLHYLALDTDQLSPYQWIYFSDGADRNCVNRLTEFKNFGGTGPSGKTVVCAEVTASTDVCTSDVIRNLEREGVLDPSLVLDTYRVDLARAYPRYDNASRAADAAVEQLEATNPGLFLHGRSARFAHRDVDELCLEASIELSDRIHTFWTLEPRFRLEVRPHSSHRAGESIDKHPGSLSLSA